MTVLRNLTPVQVETGSKLENAFLELRINQLKREMEVLKMIRSEAAKYLDDLQNVDDLQKLKLKLKILSNILKRVEK